MSSFQPKPCKHCGGLHTSLMCQKKARRPLNSKLNSNTPLKTKKALHWRGPRTAEWIEFRNQWIQDHPGPWQCFYCGIDLAIDDPDIAILTLDHKLARSRRQDLRLDPDNIVPACSTDNEAKGSLSAEEYIKIKKKGTK